MVPYCKLIWFINFESILDQKLPWLFSEFSLSQALACGWALSYDQQCVWTKGAVIQMDWQKIISVHNVTNSIKFKVECIETKLQFYWQVIFGSMWPRKFTELSLIYSLILLQCLLICNISFLSACMKKVQSLRRDPTHRAYHISSFLEWSCVIALKMIFHRRPSCSGQEQKNWSL